MSTTTFPVFTFGDLAAKYRGLAGIYSEIPGMVDGAALCHMVVADVSRLIENEFEQPIKLSVAALESGYSRDHLRRMIRAQRLTSYRRGRIHYVLLSDIRKRPDVAMRDEPERAAGVPAGSPATRHVNTAMTARSVSPPYMAIDAVQGSRTRALDVKAADGYDASADARHMLAVIRGRRRES